MAITYNNSVAGSVITSGGAVSFTTSGNKIGIVLNAVDNAFNSSITSVTYGGVAMTQNQGVSGQYSFYLTDAPAGTNDIIINGSFTAIYFVAASYTGVATDIADTGNKVESASSPCTVTTTVTVAGSKVIYSGQNYKAGAATNISSNKTNRKISYSYNSVALILADETVSTNTSGNITTSNSTPSL